MTKEEIGRIIRTLKSEKKCPVSVVSRYMQRNIECPENYEYNYSVGTLLTYLQERDMAMTLYNRMFGETVNIDSDDMLEYAIRRGMNFFNLSMNDLIADNLGYKGNRKGAGMISISRFCRLMDRLCYEVTIADKD